MGSVPFSFFGALGGGTVDGMTCAFGTPALPHGKPSRVIISVV